MRIRGLYWDCGMFVYSLRGLIKGIVWYSDNFDYCV